MQSKGVSVRVSCRIASLNTRPVCSFVAEWHLKPMFIQDSENGGENRPMKWFSVVLMVLLLPMSPQVWAHRDQDRARQAVQSGQILPLNKVLTQVEAQHPGQVLEVELEQKGGRWLYEIKVIDATGQMMRLHVDATTGAILSRRVRLPGPHDAESRPSK